MFKKFIQRIIEAENGRDALENVFYSNEYQMGINTAFTEGLITWKEHQMLLALIEKMA